MFECMTHGGVDLADLSIRDSAGSDGSPRLRCLGLGDRPAGRGHSPGRRVCLWGEHSDFCDGCLTLEPDDYRFALRFTVHVPKSYGKLLDVTSCSGTLSVDDGNDEDAFTEVLGDYNKNLDGRMRPGSTKYGVNEYGIKKNYVKRGTTSTYTNSCGDPDYETGVVGIWNGKIPVS